MRELFPDGVWPVMLTPFTDDDKVDFPALKRLVDWYVENGVTGLFAVCQSSEMFFLSLEERAAISKAVVEAAAGRVGVGLWGDPPEAALAGFYPVSESGRQPFVYVTQKMEWDPAVLWTKASGLFMPVLYNPNSLWIAKEKAAE